MYELSTLFFVTWLRRNW